MGNLKTLINNSQTLGEIYQSLEQTLPIAAMRIFRSHLNNFMLEQDNLTNDDIVRFQNECAHSMHNKEFAAREIFEMSNVIQIYGKAFVELQNSSLSEKKVDKEWLFRFYDYAKTCSQKEKQELWSKVLCDELKAPKSFYVRTLDVLDKAESFELDWFYSAVRMAFDRSCIPVFAMNDNRFYHFNQFQTLIDAGFLNASEAVLELTDTATLHFPNADVQMETVKDKYNFHVYTLTDAGSQLCQLKSASASDDFLNRLQELLGRNERVKIISINRK